MSPVFRHGGLRLYLLKLLDEAPRHGYDVIRLLQDKFLGVYSPSPGTIYPRLARLEEEGLVTHETVDGKKIYRITDAGRAELNRRLDDLADLEDELAASVRDIAKEITRDVRETVRNLRDELTWAVREAGRSGGSAGSRAEPRAEPDGQPGPDPNTGSGSGSWSAATSDADAGQTSGDSAKDPVDLDSSDTRSDDHEPDDQAGEPHREHRHGDWRDWADWAERGGWRDWADWAKRQGWADWASKQDWRDRVKANPSEWAQSEWAQSEWARRPDWLKGAGTRAGEPRGKSGGGAAGGQAGPDLVSDLEHLATAFAEEIRGVARHAENAGEDAAGNLGRILGDTLSRIMTEVFRAPKPSSDQPASPETPADDDRSAHPGDPSPPAGPE